MVVGEGYVHHRSDGHPAVARHGALLYRVQSQDGALRRIDNRRRQQRAVDTAIGNRESSALELVGPSLFSRAPGEIVDGALDLGKAHAIGTAQDRHHQTFAATDRDADVVSTVVNDVVSDSAFTSRTVCNAVIAALTKKDMKASLIACLSRKASPCLWRSLMIADMSISLNVVSKAVLCWAATKRSAMRRRSMDIGAI